MKRASGQRQTFVMKRRDFIALVGGLASAASVRALAQPQVIPVVGFLNTGWPGPAAPLLAAFRNALAAAGYVEGRNIAIEYRWAEGRYQRLEALAAELVSANVAVIAATGGTVAAKAARAATSRIPVLFIAGFDPVREGLVDSINRPGGNATGVGVYTAELGKKRLEMLHYLVKRDTIAMLVNPNAVSTAAEIKDARDFAADRRLTLIVLEAATDREIERGFAEAVARGANALLVSADSFFTSERVRIVDLATRHKIPVCYPWPQYIEAGGLMSYGTNLVWAYEQVGIYTARILKGDKPGELPVVFPTVFQTIINLKVAKELGLAVPADAVITADQVIE
jgi:putative ABC transport system substrate-binding protein